MVHLPESSPSPLRRWPWLRLLRDSGGLVPFPMPSALVWTLCAMNSEGLCQWQPAGQGCEAQGYPTCLENADSTLLT